MSNAVQRTLDFERIAALPRRPQGVDPAHVATLTALLTTDEGKRAGARLFDVQAQAFLEMHQQGGLLGIIGVGEGKTLITFLAPLILGAQRPLLLVPGGLRAKTEADLIKYRRHWRVPTNIRIMSYDYLGRKQAAREIEAYDPDLVMGDEIQRLKSFLAAVTKRIDQQLTARPATRVVALTGTMMSKSIRDFRHIAIWSLKNGAPVPLDEAEGDEWASALDKDEDLDGKFSPLTRCEPGALMDFASAEDLAAVSRLELEAIVAARRGFRQRLTETPGVVVTQGGGNVAAALNITGVAYDLAPASEEHFRRLREDMLTPDGYELVNGVEVWRHAKEMALGFHSVWDPRPPEEWLAPRKRWGQYVRAILKHAAGVKKGHPLYGLFSPDMVRDAVLEGMLDDEGALAAWEAIQHPDHPHYYVPTVREIWHDDSVLRLAAEWAEREPGIVWCEHTFFARRLSLETGLPYYGAEGKCTANGKSIEYADCSRSIIASWKANHEGRNLQGDRDRAGGPWQGFGRNLIVSPNESAKEWQQGLARTHRTGTDDWREEVTVDVLIGCREHASAWRKVLSGTDAIEQTIGGGKPKLHLATIDMSAFPALQDDLGEGAPVGFGWRW